MTTESAAIAANPLIATSELPYGLPPFAQIKFEHFRPAIEFAMAEQTQAIAAITANPDPATFANTVLPLELAEVRIERVLSIFQNRAAADMDDQINALQAELAPKLAAHEDAILLDSTLFARLATVEAAAEELDPESAYLLERMMVRFRLAGAALGDEDKQRLKQLNERIAALQVEFKVRLQADSKALALVIEDPQELDGLTAGELAAASLAAQARGLDGKYLITLVAPTAHPYLASLTNPEVRERLMVAQRSRGARGNDNDTRGIALEILRLRAQLAQLLGFQDFAALRTANSTAKTPADVRGLLERLAPAAAASARAEQAKLEANAGRPLRPSDWPFYAERVRAAEYDVDTAALRAYFELERVLRDGVFFAANKLFGLTFTERPDLVGYHPDVRVFEVKEEDGTPVGLYLLDLYARDSKRGGAWMSSFADAARAIGSETAIVINVLNVPKPSAGEATLLTFTETSTLFHEMGHALHGLLGKANYPSLSGTAVFRDFVELPSQLNEMWMLWPETLANYAVDHDTGEPIPAEVVERLLAARTFNEGYETTEYLAASVIDLAWHSLAPNQVPTDPEQIPAFEAAALEAAGLNLPLIPPRYTASYFSHIFTLGYSASYYAYIWADVLVGDTSEWFEANGGLRRQNGAAYREHVLSFGGTREPLAAYVEWRGRKAPVEPLLRRRGLLTPA